ncbi:MAG: hypothetical protein GY805_26530 [Chloroflexi bacterium]|nr:hypothetical protein [Chloroflexota bacterium]
MIYLALYLTYSLGTLAVLGLLTGKIFGKIFSIPFSFDDVGFVNTLLLGIVSLTTILSYLSLIFPINLYIHLIVLLCLIGWVLTNQAYVAAAAKKFYGQFQQNYYLLVAGAFCLLAGIVFASGPIKGYDTGLYHAQAVKWINEYGVVPGLGNLHFRLAFNSSWLVFSSYFDLLAFDGKSYHLMNLIIYAIGLVVCFRGLANLINGNVKISSVVSSLLMLFFIARYKVIASLSTDFPATALLFFTLIMVIEVIEKHIEKQNGRIISSETLIQRFFLVVLLATFAFTVKLSVAPVVFFPLLLFLIIRQKSFPVFANSIILGLVVLLPFFLRNLILSGYLVFPFPSVDWFGFDWKVPYENALSIKEQTKYLIYTAEFNSTLAPDVGLAEWLKDWFEIHISGNLKLTFYLLISPLLMGPFLFVCFGSGRFKKYVHILLIQALLGIGVIFWLVSGPEPRLGAGWILSLAIFPIAVVLDFVLKMRWNNGRIFNSYLAYGLLLIFCLWLAQVSGFRARLIGEDAYLIWTIEPLPQAELKIVETASGVKLYVPVEGDQVWDGALPSTPYINDNLEMRGDTLVDGFRVRHQ